MPDRSEPSSRLPVTGHLVSVELLHARCGKPAREHPHPGIVEQVCPFPALPHAGIPLEFVRDTEPRVLVRGLPDPAHMPEPVAAALDQLAAACREAYGMGVEVTADGDLDDIRDALDTIRRRLDL